jgi:hypothetical protein
MTNGADSAADDRLMQSTCEEMVALLRGAFAAEPPGNVTTLQVPNGPVVGKQFTIDATETDGLMNRCRLSLMDPVTAPASEAARFEYEHEKESGNDIIEVYSIQSLRQQAGKYVFLENFLAEQPETVREQDFRPISSAAYAQTVLKGLEGWIKFRAYQLQQGGK